MEALEAPDDGNGGVVPTIDEAAGRIHDSLNGRHHDLMIRSAYSSELASRLSYLLLGLPTSMLWIVIFTTVFGMALGLVFVLIGVPLLAVAMTGVRYAGDVERWMIHELLGVAIQPARPTNAPKGRWRTLVNELVEPRNWRAFAFIALRSITGPLVFAFAVVAVGYPVWAIVFGWWVGGEIVFPILVTGVVAAIVAPLLIGAVAEGHVTIARALLGPSTTQLTERADTIQANRDRSVEAAEAERRRIERDLHDGAQARLSTVALDLGRAKRRIDQGGDPAEIRQIIDSAHDDAKAAIVELRDLARGIHPPVLTDRGLAGALDELVRQCPIPVHADIWTDPRPAPHIESAAYFAISELLTNATRHSRASHVWVTIRGDRHEVVIDVTDDGVGGVDPSLGSGIRGLEDRIAALDGSFTTRSELGHGTSVLIELPNPSRNPVDSGG